MTLDEAIKHAEEVAEENEGLCERIHPAMQLSDYSKCAEEHRQLAEWLKELKELKEQQSEDAISRAETVQFLINHSNDFEDAKIRMAFQAASSLVNNPHNLPSVYPKPKTGHWIVENRGNNGH